MEFRLEHGTLPGEEVRRLMRRYGKTIRELSLETGITMKRIREVRDRGLADRNAIRDWIQAIVGSDPGSI